MVTRDDIIQHIRRNNLDKAFSELFLIMEKATKLGMEGAEERYNELINVSGQYEGLKSDRIHNLIDYERYSRESAHVRQFLLRFVQNMPDEMFTISETQVVKPEASWRELILLDDKSAAFEYDVFLSFSNKNKDFVKKEIADILRGYGLRVFVYFESIAENVGNSWVQKIGEALEKSRHFVLICTPESMKSNNVIDEYQNFYNQIHSKDRRRKFIVFEGPGFSENLLNILYRNKDRATSANDLIEGLIDVKYLNARYRTKQREQRRAEEKEKQQLEKKLAALRKENEQLQQQISLQQLSFQLIDDAHQKGVEEGKKTVAPEAEKLQKQLDEKTAEITQLEQRIAAYEKQIAQGRQGANEAAVKELQKELNEKSAEVTELKQRIAGYSLTKTNTTKEKILKFATVALIILVVLLIWHPWDSRTMQVADSDTETTEETEGTTAEEETPPPEMTNEAITETINGLDFEFLPVPGGTFEMGSNSSEANDDEQPVHTVTVSGFYMGKYEVTQAQWRAVMGNNLSYFDGCDDCPVENVSWNDVQEFIQKLNEQTGKTFRLPTEAEWEYAARGGESYTYAGSNNIGSVAWYDDNSGSKTHPVGQKQPNALGLYDMSGNVWEWCSDWYDSDYYGNSPQNNPQGPSSGSNRVARGGSWFDHAGGCRVAYRGRSAPGFSSNFLGFRLVFVP